MNSANFSRAAAALLLVSIASTSPGERLIGVSSLSERIILDTDDPGRYAASDLGLSAAGTPLGSAIRPSDAKLYILTDSSGVTKRYVAEVEGGIAQLLGTTTIPLSDLKGMTFDPLTNQIRCTTATGKNYSINPDTGSVTTLTDLAFAPGDVNSGVVASNIYGLAYGYEPGAASPTLYGIDYTHDSLVTIGTKTQSADGGRVHTIGPLHRTTAAKIPMAISSYSDIAYCYMPVSGGNSYLCTIDREIGDARLIQDLTIESPNLFVGLSVVPPKQYETIVTCNSGSIFTFRTDNTNSPLSFVTINGIPGTEKIIGMDYRPANNLLYVLTSTGRVCTVDPYVGILTVVGGPISTLPVGPGIGFDFNPVPDRMRVTSGTDQNLRIDPTSLSVTNDTVLAYAIGDGSAGANPLVCGSAYTNSFAGAFTTTLYDIDAATDKLVIQNPPNNGTLNSVGALGENIADAAFDISGVTGKAYIVYTHASDTDSTLGEINLTSGGIFAPRGAATGFGVMNAAAVVASQTRDRIVALSVLKAAHWEKFQIEPFYDAPDFDDANGLKLSLATNPAVTFGAWQTAPLDAAPVGKWKLRFFVTQNRNAADRLPELRIRAFRADNTKNSIGGAADVGALPTSSGYPAYVEVPWTSDGVSQWRVAIDMIAADPGMRGGFTISNITMYRDY
ncbi:hypothetical protein BH09SUM1_BH09SUM1_28400 [soil metagenome]